MDARSSRSRSRDSELGPQRVVIRELTGQLMGVVGRDGAHEIEEPRIAVIAECQDRNLTRFGEPCDLVVELVLARLEDRPRDPLELLRRSEARRGKGVVVGGALTVDVEIAEKDEGVAPGVLALRPIGEPPRDAAE